MRLTISVIIGVLVYLALTILFLQIIDVIPPKLLRLACGILAFGFCFAIISVVKRKVRI